MAVEIVFLLAAVRLDAARQFVLDTPPASGIVVVGATRGAADDFVRTLAGQRGATLAAAAASASAPTYRTPRRAAAGGRPSDAGHALGIEAVAARAVYDAHSGSGLRVLRAGGGLADSRALARTLEELALASVPAGHPERHERRRHDIRGPARAVRRTVDAAATVESTRITTPPLARWRPGGPRSSVAGVVLLDVAIANTAERDFVVERLGGQRAGRPGHRTAGDAATERALAGVSTIDRLDPGAGGFDRVRRRRPGLSASRGGAGADRDLVGAGEGREAVEIARRVLREARAGTAFDQMAIALRTPRRLPPASSNTRSNVRACAACFERGTRRPRSSSTLLLAADGARRTCARRVGSPSTSRWARCRTPVSSVHVTQLPTSPGRVLVRWPSAPTSRPRTRTTARRSKRRLVPSGPLEMGTVHAESRVV